MKQFLPLSYQNVHNELAILPDKCNCSWQLHSCPPCVNLTWTLIPQVQVV